MSRRGGSARARGRRLLMPIVAAAAVALIASFIMITLFRESPYVEVRPLINGTTFVAPGLDALGVAEVVWRGAEVISVLVLSNVTDVEAALVFADGGNVTLPVGEWVTVVPPSPEGSAKVVILRPEALWGEPIWVEVHARAG